MKRSEFMEMNFLDEDDMASIDNKLMLYFSRPTEDTYSLIDTHIRLHRLCGRDIVQLLSHPNHQLDKFSSLNSFITMVGQSFDRGLKAGTFWEAVKSVSRKLI